MRVVMELENEEAIEKMVGIGVGTGFVSRRRADAGSLRYVRPRGVVLLAETCAVFLAHSHDARGQSISCDMSRTGATTPVLSHDTHAGRGCFYRKKDSSRPCAGASRPCPQKKRSSAGL